MVTMAVTTMVMMTTTMIMVLDHLPRSIRRHGHDGERAINVATGTPCPLLLLLRPHSVAAQQLGALGREARFALVDVLLVLDVALLVAAVDGIPVDDLGAVTGGFLLRRRRRRCWRNIDLGLHHRTRGGGVQAVGGANRQHRLGRGLLG
jgi:hypothetical protein